MFMSELFVILYLSFTTYIMLNIATFNVRGLSNSLKQEHLGTDVLDYHIDILALQETKVTAFTDSILPSGVRLISFEQTLSYHGGLGFAIHPRLATYVDSWKRISDRVAYLDMIFECKNKTNITCRFVNVYSPHRGLIKKTPQIATQFYNEVSGAINIPSRWELFMLGDFNSKLGKRDYNDECNGLDKYMGKYGNGTRNDCGETLLNFMIANNLFAANTAFQHKSRHVTTYTGWVKDWNAGRHSKQTKPFFSQIDYILCRNRSKTLLVNARAYAGTSVSSDHKLVIAQLDFKNRILCFKRSKFVQNKYDCALLSSDHEVKQEYHSQVNLAISTCKIESML